MLTIQTRYIAVFLSLYFLTTCYEDPRPALLNFDPVELNFEEDSTSLSFAIYNDGEQDLAWEIAKSADWIETFEMNTGLLHCNDVARIIVNIDRSKLSSGNNESQIKINDKSITIKAFHSFRPKDINLSNRRIKDLQPVNTLVGILTTIDQDPSDKHIYSLIAGVGDDDNSKFRIENNKLMSYAVFDFSLKSNYKIRVKSTDSKGKSIEKPFIIIITDSNETPTDIVLNNNTILEKKPIGTLIGVFSTTDSPGDSHIYSLISGLGSSDNVNFEIEGDSLKSKIVFDLKLKSTYTIRLKSTDIRGQFFEKIFNILITDRNNPPRDISLDKNTIAENEPSSTLIGKLSSVDDGGDVHTYKLVNGSGDTGNSKFSITGNNLSSKASFNYESQTSYSIRVESKDAGNKVYVKVFTIFIINTNEPVTDLFLDRNTIQENRAINTIIGVFSSTDVDIGDTHTYSLVAGFGDNANFKIDGSILKSAVVFDFETKKMHNIKVKSQDAGGASFEKTFDITIIDSHEPATDITLSANSIDENKAINTIIGNLTSTDEDAGDTHTYALVAGSGDTDNANFQIIGNTLRSQKSFNFETQRVHNIRIESKDSRNQIYQKTFFVLINDVNDPPTDLILSNNDIDENKALNTAIGNLTSADEDAGDTHTYTLVAGPGDTDNASFVIDGNALKSAATFDFETKNLYIIRLRTTDASGLFTEKILTIDITNVRTWIRHTAPWSSRSAHTAVVFKDTLWVLGGTSTLDFGTPKNDVWYSSDGINWTQATASASWAARCNHTSVVFDNKIWVLGGRTGTTTPWTTSRNDVWYSSDGINWTQATNSAAWPVRRGHSSVVFDGKIWVLGGASATTQYGDAWYSSDGVTWTRATANAFPSTRYLHASVTFDNKIWIMGGYEDASRNKKNDVRYSSDGSTWIEATSGAAWSRRQGLDATVFDNKMWISAGIDDGSFFSGNIYYSSNGSTWTIETTSIRPRRQHTMVSFKNSIWIIAGEVSSGGLGSITQNYVFELDR